MSREQWARAERDAYARELANEDHRKRVGRVYARRLLYCAILPALLGMVLFLEAARATPEAILTPVFAFVVLTVALYALVCILLGPPNVPMPKSHSSSVGR